MVRKACRNFEKIDELSEGEAYEEWIDQHSMKVPDWSMADITDYGEIDKHKKRREDCGLDRGCSSVSNDRCLHPLVERVKPGLNAVSLTEWVLIDVIADSGACETVMPKNLCANITLRESEASKAGVEYEVASGKAVPNLGERETLRNLLRGCRVIHDDALPSSRHSSTTVITEPCSGPRLQKPF